MSLILNWNYRDSGKNRHELDNVDLNSDVFNKLDGVYIIYYQVGRWASSVITVYVGQGTIKERLHAHRDDPRIQQFGNNTLRGIQETLYVTWADVPSKDKRNRIEKFLHDKLNPSVNEISPAVPPQPVNLPWETTSTFSL